ncbi:MAG: arginine decarboxylase, partial [Aeromonas sp.]
THCAEVWLDEQGEMDIRNVVRGDTVDQLLRYVNIDPSVIRENYHQIAHKLALGDDARKALLDELELGLQGYAYLEEE